MWSQRLFARRLPLLLLLLGMTLLLAGCPKDGGGY
jgi:hypothetical protein